MAVVFGQFVLFVFDKTYEYAMGKSGKKIDINSDFKAYIIQ